MRLRSVMARFGDDRGGRYFKNFSPKMSAGIGGDICQTRYLSL